MAKDKKKSLGIKTTRYFTKTCGQCKFEYPNWFTNCPKCGATWDSAIEKSTIQKELLKKTIKIVVKITEEDFNETIHFVQLIFSADQGKSWYQMSMENKQDYFIAEILDVPTHITMIYYIQVNLANGEQIIENNNGQYFYYKVGAPIEHFEESQNFQQQDSIKEVHKYDYEQEVSPIESRPTTEEINYFKPKEPEPSAPNLPPQINPPSNPIHYDTEKNFTIFGKPQTEVDPDLKTCPYCQSKIKKMWSTCPICGRDI